MVDIVIAPASVIPQTSNAITTTALAGAAISAGQVVYLEAATGILQLADCNAVTAEARIPVGIALNTAATGQPVTFIKGGDLVMSAILTKGARYYLSATAGGIAPEADMTGGGKDVVLIGIARSTTVLAVFNIAPGITL